MVQQALAPQAETRRRRRELDDLNILQQEGDVVNMPFHMEVDSKHHEAFEGPQQDISRLSIPDPVVELNARINRLRSQKSDAIMNEDEELEQQLQSEIDELDVQYGRLISGPDPVVELNARINRLRSQKSDAQDEIDTQNIWTDADELQEDYQIECDASVGEVGDFYECPPDEWSNWCYDRDADECTGIRQNDDAVDESVPVPIPKAQTPGPRRRIRELGETSKVEQSEVEKFSSDDLIKKCERYNDLNTIEEMRRACVYDQNCLISPGPNDTEICGWRGLDNFRDE
jgi:hypothetical protein